MIAHIKLSTLLDEVQETILDRFGAEEYWVQAQIMNVKKQPAARRCYLTLEEYENGVKTADARAVFWATCYNQIENFEKLTKQVFKDGIQIICKVKVRYHKIYGFNLDVLQIDIAHTVGTLELERQQTLERLVKENPATIQLYDGVYRTYNNRLPLPLIIERIALITAPNSDGQRDFQQEIRNNKHQYRFSVTEYLTTIQGDNAHRLILDQLKLVEKNTDGFDAVAIVRGGGSQADFRPFDDYELAKCIAHFPVPVFTGIGHDRNQSIADLMAREQKTPTKVAATLVEHNFEFENALIDLKLRVAEAVKQQLKNAKDKLDSARRIVKLSSPQAILDRGFAIITINNKIITDPKDIPAHAELQTLLRDSIIHSTVTKKTNHEDQAQL